MSDLETLLTLAEQLAEVARDDPSLATRARRAASRLRKGQFHVMVLGEFNRGKSTLVNALLGVDALPTGVLPLTAIRTEVGYGQAGATIVTRGGRRCDVGIEGLAAFVTESGNPGNAREVEKVEVRVPSGLLASGLVLVDTPGLASVHLHNTAVARSSLLEADGAIVVLSADEPLSEEERRLLDTLGHRRVRTFLVVNKADHLEPTELESVRSFVTSQVAQVFEAMPLLYCISARSQLAATRRAERAEEPSFGDWDAFVQALRHFADVELSEARLAASRSELARIGAELRGALLLRRAAVELDVATLSEQVELFRSSAETQRQAFAEDTALLDHDLKTLMEGIGVSLAAFARRAPTRWEASLEREATALPIGGLEDRLRAVVEEAVREDFEPFRAQELRRVELAWSERAARFRRRTQARMDAVRSAASNLFSVDLPATVVPAVSDEPETFSFLFVHVGSTSEGLERGARRLLPRRMRRRRALAKANDDLRREFDKHAGRARWDLEQRLEAVRSRFESVMLAELERTIKAILTAASRADQLRDLSLAEREKYDAADKRALGIADSAIAADV